MVIMSACARLQLHVRQRMTCTCRLQSQKSEFQADAATAKDAKMECSAPAAPVVVDNASSVVKQVKKQAQSHLDRMEALTQAWREEAKLVALVRQRLAHLGCNPSWD